MVSLEDVLIMEMNSELMEASNTEHSNGTTCCLCSVYIFRIRGYACE